MRNRSADALALMDEIDRFRASIREKYPNAFRVADEAEMNEREEDRRLPYRGGRNNPHTIYEVSELADTTHFDDVCIAAVFAPKHTKIVVAALNHMYGEDWRDRIARAAEEKLS